MSRSTSVAILLIVSLATGAASANAHTKLESANPAIGAVVKASPKKIRMTFSEELVAAFSGVEVKNSDGKPIPMGKMTFARGDARKMIVPIATRLAPGTYSVAWHAVSVDTHRISGRYTFKVSR